MIYRYSDGGRHDAGFRGDTRDCAVRAIAIATGLPYPKVYNELFERQRAFLASRRVRKWKKDPSPRTGVYREVYEPYLFDLGWIWHPTMQIGSGCQVHLVDHELAMGPLVVRLSRHVTAVVDGVCFDTFDPSRGGTRCVYGWYEPAGPEAAHAPSIAL